jgi:hypothetical protein
MLIIIEVVNKQNLKTMKNLFYSLVVVLCLGLTSCGGSSESTPSTDSTAVDSCHVDSCVVDSCKKVTVK